MNKVIGLYGRANVGKTQTLNFLIDLLEVATTGCIMPTPQPIGSERRIVFNYNNQIVGVCTKGDGGAEVKSNCEFFQENNCDIAFSATRTKGESCNELKKYAEDNSTSVTWIKKIIVDSDYEAFALEQAHELFELIKQS